MIASDSGSRRAASGGASLRSHTATARAITSARATSSEYRVRFRIRYVFTLSQPWPQCQLFRDGEGVDLAEAAHTSSAWRQDAVLTARCVGLNSELVGARRNLLRLELHLVAFGTTGGVNDAASPGAEFAPVGVQAEADHRVLAGGDSIGRVDEELDRP